MLKALDPKFVPCNDPSGATSAAYVAANTQVFDQLMRSAMLAKCNCSIVALLYTCVRPAMRDCSHYTNVVLVIADTQCHAGINIDT